MRSPRAENLPGRCIKENPSWIGPLLHQELQFTSLCMTLKGNDLSAIKDELLDIYNSKFIHRQCHGVNQKGEKRIRKRVQHYACQKKTKKPNPKMFRAPPAPGSRICLNRLGQIGLTLLKPAYLSISKYRGWGGLRFFLEMTYQ